MFFSMGIQKYVTKSYAQVPFAPKIHITVSYDKKQKRDFTGIRVRTTPGTALSYWVYCFPYLK